MCIKISLKEGKLLYAVSHSFPNLRLTAMGLGGKKGKDDLKIEYI
jgi:hypothetical protein